MDEAADPVDHASKLVTQHGPHEAWLIATAAGVEAHLARDVDRREHWRAVQLELTRSAPRPGPGDLDIYRTAHLMIAASGAREASLQAIQRGVEMEGDLIGQAVWARVYEAIMVLDRKEPEAGERVQ